MKVVNIRSNNTNQIEDFQVDTDKSKKTSRIRNGLKTVGKIVGKTMIAAGLVASLVSPVIAAGTVAADAAIALVSAGTAVEAVEAIAEAGEALNNSADKEIVPEM